tara:strand:- start:109 stop:1089 length:981 start_codon:yes stop_codon:yes gene_type:complete
MSDTNKIISFCVIIPTRNSRDYIEAHVHALNQWIYLASEVIVIDSESTDGTIEYLKDNLKHSSIKFLDHPVGLYESWNFAIAQVESDFTYIATVGDRIPKEDVIRLCHEAGSTNADIVISPPTLISPNGTSSEANWPINQYLARTRQTHAHKISPLEVLLWNITCLPGTLIGSSASNLYKTRALASSPFPTNCGHAGDSAWAISNSINLSWHIIPDLYSEFLTHGSGKKNRGPSHRKRAELYRLAHFALEEARITEANPTLFNILHSLLKELKDKESTVENFNVFRDEHSLWFLSPKGWILRQKKKINTNEIQSLKTKAIQYYYKK